MRLKSGAGFFAKETYTVTLKLDGHDTRKVTVDCKLNGWYFGNLLLGGLVGFLIVDPATGAMYKLDSIGLTENLTKTVGTTSLHIIDKNKLSSDAQKHLVELK
jgi:hypothetical protein